MAAALHRSAELEPFDEATPATGTGFSPEVFRQVYVSLGLAPDACPVVGVTSSIRGEGRTTAAVSLASVLANDLSVRTLLVEVDLERPALAKLFGLPPARGLADILRTGGQLLDVTRPVSENLSLVTAGTDESDAMRLLHELPHTDLFRALQGTARVTILDLPPIMNYSYGPLTSRAADAVLLVVRAGVTPVDIVQEAVGRLGDRPPRGVVLNGAQQALPAWWPDVAT